MTTEPYNIPNVSAHLAGVVGLAALALHYSMVWLVWIREIKNPNAVGGFVTMALIAHQGDKRLVACVMHERSRVERLRTRGLILVISTQ
jgi:hypothetical protein